MHPPLAIDDSAYLGATDAAPFREPRIRIAHETERSNCRNILQSEFGLPIFLAPILALLRDHIRDVAGLVSKEEMRRVDARRNVTSMQDMSAGWDRSNKLAIGSSVALSVAFGPTLV